MEPLTDLEQQLLAFERRWWKHAGAKEQAIHDEFDGMSATRYYQLLNALIDKPAALATDPMTVKRRLRLRTAGRQARRSG